VGQVSKYLRSVQNGHAHWCPGCNEMHVIPNMWEFNGDVEKPTFSPSVKITFPKGYYKNDVFSDKVDICHYFLTNGVLNFCGDSTHELAGKSVSLPELPEELEDASGDDSTNN
jgi:hypothetical protein